MWRVLYVELESKQKLYREPLTGSMNSAFTALGKLRLLNYFDKGSVAHNVATATLWATELLSLSYRTLSNQ